MLIKIWRVFIFVSLSIAPAYPLFSQVSFFSPPTFQGEGNLMVADFNRDGRPDILTWDGTLQLGTGGGAFASPTTVPGCTGFSSPTANPTCPVLVADFNGDGIPDILEQGSGTLLVLLGNGDGTFQPAISTVINGNISGLAAANLNADNFADLVAVSGTSLLVFLSNGNGTFAPPVTYNLGTNGSVISLGDFNGDGKTDIAVGISGQEIVFLNSGDGTFKTPGITSATGSTIDFATVGDFNNDGKLDMAVSEPSCSATCPAIYILPGNGDGTFGTPILAFRADGPLAAADVNGDGKLDLLSAPPGSGYGFMLASGTIQSFLGNGDFTFTNAGNYASLNYFFTEIPYGGTSVGIAVADFDGDGKLDIAVSGGAILLGNGDGTFKGVPAASAPIGTTVVGSFGQNHTPAIAALSGTQLSIFVMNGPFALSLTHTYALQQPGSGIVAADFNGDGAIDLAIVGTDSQNENWYYIVLLGNADGTFQSPTLFQQSGALTGSIAVADFNNDGKADLLVGAGGQEQMAVLLGNGDGTFTAPLYSTGYQSSMIADFDGDGNLDIASGQSTGTVISYGNGDGTFKPPVSPPSVDGFVAAFTADVNNDGKADLVAGRCWDCGVDVLLGNGDGTFTSVCCLPPTSGTFAFNILAISDFNGDGNADLVTSLINGQMPAPGVSLGSGNGWFLGGASFPGFVVGPFPSLVADVNGDGLPDIVFNSGVLLNTTPVAPNFSIGLTPGSSPSRNISAGQTAAFTLVVAPIGSFSGTVQLNCSISGAASPAPTCSLSSSSLQLTGIGTQSVTVNVVNTGQSITGSIHYFEFLPSAIPLLGGLFLLCVTYPQARNRRRMKVLFGPSLALVLSLILSCGGASSSQQHSKGAPTGPYTVTITAVSGGLSHSINLHVNVQ